MRKICILFLIIVFPTISFAQNDEITWDYPVKPGSEEWKTLKNNAEKVKACQVPSKLLTTLNTEELINICLKYPLLPDIFAFNNIKNGFEKFENDFNGFRELLKRNDTSDKILTIYKSIDPDDIPDNETIQQKGNYVLKTSFLELFISHPKVVLKLEKDDKKEIIKVLLSKKEKKKNRLDWYQGKGIQTSYFAIFQLIQHDEIKLQSELDMTNVLSYICSGIITNSKVMDQIDQVAIDYIKSK